MNEEPVFWVALKYPKGKGKKIKLDLEFSRGLSQKQRKLLVGQHRLAEKVINLIAGRSQEEFLRALITPMLLFMGELTPEHQQILRDSMQRIFEEHMQPDEEDLSYVQ